MKELKPAARIRTARFAFGALGCVFLVGGIIGCATTIPATDNEKPRVELIISGPGIGTESMSNPPREVWLGEGGTQLFDLSPDEEYGFTLIVSDEGGVARATLQMPDEFEILELEPDDVIREAHPISHRLTVTGTREDPRTTLVISGRFRTTGALGFDFNVEGTDFGGSAGTPNQRFLQVQASVDLL